MLGDDLTAVLPELRAQAASLRTAACTITRPSTDGTFDPETGTTTYPETTIYEGECRLRAPSLADRETFSGEHEFTLQDAVLSLPIEAVGLKTNDLVTVTASAMDPDLIGRQYTLIAVHRGSQITARRCVVREVGA